MSAYQQEQLEALQMVRRHLRYTQASDRRRLADMTRDYRAYRQEVDAFLKTHLERLFIKAGYSSPLMYMHNSPGLLRVKQRSPLGYSETIQKDR